MLKEGRNAPGADKTMAQAAQHIWRQRGLRGFYSGMIPSLIGVSHGAIQFTCYEQLKLWRLSIRTAGISKEEAKDIRLGVRDHLLTSAVAKVIAGTITYPYQTLRTRLQIPELGDSRKIVGLIRQMYLREGMKSFYKGYARPIEVSTTPALTLHSIAPNLVRVLPATCINFLAYEEIKKAYPEFMAGVLSTDAPDES
jgi:solute carrier family 25 folate transporter 32